MVETKCRAKDPTTCWKHGRNASLTSSVKNYIPLLTNKEAILKSWNVKPVLKSSLLTEQYFTERLKRVEQAFRSSLQTIDDSRFFDKEKNIWTPARQKIHNEIINEAISKAENIPCEYQILLMGGVSGAGKTHIRENLKNRKNFFVIDPDIIRQEFVKKGASPTLIHYNYLTPAERGVLLYSEASIVVERISKQLRKKGTNLIIDQTMTDLNVTRGRIKSIQTSGYNNIKAIFVNVDIETSKIRAIARWRKGEEASGRFMSPSIIQKSSHQHASSKNFVTFDTLKNEKMFNAWQIWDNNVTGKETTEINSFNWD